MKILLFVLFSTLGSQLYSQGNLQFNQVLSPSISVTNMLLAYTSQQTTVTVPAGKIWKVESASFVWTSGSEIGVAQMGGQQTITNPYFFIDDYILGTYINNYGLVDPIFPIWLKSGNHILRISNNSNVNYNGNLRGTLSVIEFNIIP